MASERDSEKGEAPSGVSPTVHYATAHMELDLEPPTDDEQEEES